MTERRKKIFTISVIAGLIGILLLVYGKRWLFDYRLMKKNQQWEQNPPEGNTVNGRKEGKWLTYFENGQLAATETYHNDTLNGPSIHYTPEGKYNSRNTYRNGIKIDSSFLYSGDGNLNYMCYYDSNGVEQGPFRIYYKDGTVGQEGQSKDGKFDGEFKVYYQSGKLQSLEYYKSGQQIGVWLKFAENGDTTSVVRY